MKRSMKRWPDMDDLLRTMSYIIVCTLEFLFPRDLTPIKHIVNVKKSKGPQNPI